MTDKKPKNEKPKIAPKTLSGLGGVKHEKQTSLKTTPKIVSYWLFDEDDSSVRGESSARGNPTVFKVDDILPLSKVNSNHADVTADVFKHVMNHVQKHGTIKELWIEGHGSKLSMGDNHNKEFNINYFLAYIDKVSDGGIITNFPKFTKKIADRIIFDGCSTFEKLNDYEIERIRNIANKYDIEIVGTTSSVSDTRGRGENDVLELMVEFTAFFGIPIRQLDGRYVQFTPKGEVVRDKLDNRWNGTNTLFDDRSWIDYHLNHTQEEGHKLRLESEKHDLEIKNFWLNRGKRGTSLGNPEK